MINITKEPTPFYPAYNDSYISFNTTYNNDNKAVLKIENLPYTFTIYPNIQGNYLFNLKHIATSIGNTNKFLDTINPNYEGWGFADENLTFEFNLIIEVYGDSSSESITNTYSFTRGVKQYGDKLYSNPYQLLLPSNDGVNYYVRYFEGFPFDIQFRYINYGDFLTFYNKRTTDTSPAFETTDDHPYRIFFDKGNTSWNSTNFMDLPDLLNRVDVKVNDNVKTSIDIRKEAGRCGVYLKWLNAEGGYSYWLFNSERKETYSGSEIDRMGTNFFENIYDNNRGLSLPTGKEGSTEIELKTLATAEEIRHLKSLITSPMVVMFSEFEPYSIGDWIDVKVTTRNINYSSKRTRNQVTINIELPEIQTQKY